MNSMMEKDTEQENRRGYGLSMLSAYSNDVGESEQSDEEMPVCSNGNASNTSVPMEEPVLINPSVKENDILQSIDVISVSTTLLNEKPNPSETCHADTGLVSTSTEKRDHAIQTANSSEVTEEMSVCSNGIDYNTPVPMEEPVLINPSVKENEILQSINGIGVPTKPINENPNPSETCHADANLVFTSTEKRDHIIQTSNSSKVTDEETTAVEDSSIENGVSLLITAEELPACKNNTASSVIVTTISNEQSFDINTNENGSVDLLSISTTQVIQNIDELPISEQIKPVCEINLGNDIFIDRRSRKNPYIENFSSDSESDSCSTDSDAQAIPVSSDDSSSSNEVTPVVINIPRKVKKPPPQVKTKGELALEDLPPIEDLHISVPESDIRKIGTIHSIVDTQVIVQSFLNEAPYDLDTVLFLEDGRALGKVFDVLGKVTSPLYSVRFNTKEKISDQGIKVGDAVFSAPGHKDVTIFVFTEDLKKVKGTDASWEHNNEPPAECRDFSDDEEEKQHKQRLRAKHKSRISAEGEDPTGPAQKQKFPNSRALPPKHFLKPQNFRSYPANPAAPQNGAAIPNNRAQNVQQPGPPFPNQFPNNCQQWNPQHQGPPPGNPGPDFPPWRPHWPNPEQNFSGPFRPNAPLFQPNPPLFRPNSPYFGPNPPLITSNAPPLGSNCPPPGLNGCTMPPFRADVPSFRHNSPPYPQNSENYFHPERSQSNGLHPRAREPSFQPRIPDHNQPPRVPPQQYSGQSRPQLNFGPSPPRFQPLDSPPRFQPVFPGLQRAPLFPPQNYVGHNRPPFDFGPGPQRFQAMDHPPRF